MTEAVAQQQLRAIPGPSTVLGTGPCRVADLTLLVSEELPCWWSTHMPYQHKTFNYFTDIDAASARVRSRTGPYQTRWMLIDEHTGTHVDAPSHFIPPPGSGISNAAAAGELSVDKVPLTQLMGPAVVIDVPDDLPGAAPGVSPAIPAGLIEDHERAYGRIAEGSIVLLRSGWDRRYRPGADGNAYCFDALVTHTGPGWPAPDVPAMRLLLSRGVRCVGIDSPSMGSSHDGGPVHVEGLGAGAVFIEALARLDQLPRSGAWFLFAPVKIADGSGAPGRALALIPDGGETPSDHEEGTVHGTTGVHRR